MTVHVLVVPPLGSGETLPRLAETSPLSPDEVDALHAAMVKDAALSVARSGGDLLVNYPATEADERPDGDPDPGGDPSPRAELRALLGDVLGDPDAARYEVQVGATFAARAGNAASFLLREEDADSVAILDGTAPTLGRTDLDTGAMKLRRSEVVIGPAPGGRVAYLGVSDPIDFEGAYDPPAVETLANRGVDGGYAVDFLSMHPRVETGDDLVTLVSLLRAREAAGRRVPEHTATALSDLGLHVAPADGDRRVVR